MSVFEKVQSALMQIKLDIACNVRREYVLQNENIKSLEASKRNIEKMMSEKLKNYSQHEKNSPY